MGFMPRFQKGIVQYRDWKMSKDGEVIVFWLHTGVQNRETSQAFRLPSRNTPQLPSQGRKRHTHSWLHLAPAPWSTVTWGHDCVIRCKRNTHTRSVTIREAKSL